MARRPSSIGAGQIDHTLQSHGLQPQWEESVGGSKGIQVNQIKTLPLDQAGGQQSLGALGRGSKQTGPLKHSEVRLQHRETFGVSVIHQQRACLRLLPIAEGAETTPGHQIQNPQGSSTGQDAGKKHPEIPGRPGGWIEKSTPGMKGDGSLRQ
jgi:hypothetical protein